MGEDEDGLSSNEATVRRLSTPSRRGEHGRVADARGARGRFWAKTGGAKMGLDGRRGAWLARGGDAVPDVRRRADAVTARNREDRGEMVVMAVLVNNSKFQSPICKLSFSPSSWP